MKNLYQYPNVVGYGKGFKVKDGKRLDQLACVVLVTEKRPRAALAAGELIPSRFDGMWTDVMQVGHVIAHQTPTDRWRPAPGGVSIGHYLITAGTLGLVVRINDRKVILSNNHVLANSNNAVIGDAILQPGPYDGDDDNLIARLEDFEPIQFGTAPPTCPIAEGFAQVSNVISKLLGSSHRVKAFIENQAAVNVMDAAIAMPINQADVVESVLDLGVIKDVTAPSLGMKVTKSGRTTGVTKGTITLVEATISVSYGTGKNATFEKQIITTNMSQPGDSGSLLASEGKLTAVGLLFAGSDQVTIHSPIQPILDRFGAVI